MLKSKYNPYIDWKIIQGKIFLYFKFNGVFYLEDAEQGIERWDELFQDPEYTNDKISLVWDCLEMENYESKARIAWQKTIKEHKHRIENIWLITNSATISAGAEIVAFFTSLNIRPVKSFIELENKLYA